jgi:hypothetical protein
MRETDAAPRGAAETSPTIRDVAVYLLGEGPLLGFWYHEQPPNEPPYWWRRHLRAALAASSPPSGQAPERTDGETIMDAAPGAFAAAQSPEQRCTSCGGTLDGHVGLPHCPPLAGQSPEREEDGNG